MRADLLDSLLAEYGAKKAAALVTALESGRQRLVRAEGPGEGDLPLAPEDLNEVRAMLERGLSGPLDSVHGPLFVRSYTPPPRMVVVGAVHIAQALRPMAESAGFALQVIDPRAAFADESRFSGVDLRRAWPDEALAEDPPDAHTAVVVLTHDPKLDDPALACALRSPAFYIGALGSTRTHAKRRERLAEHGFGDLEIARIHAPIGLPLGGRSAAEIAVSIMAEIIAVRHGRTLVPKGAAR